MAGRPQMVFPLMGLMQQRCQCRTEALGGAKVSFDGDAGYTMDAANDGHRSLYLSQKDGSMDKGEEDGEDGIFTVEGLAPALSPSAR